MRQHNINSAIPRTDQTDPAKFPPYEYQEFPKMLVGKDGKNVVNPQTLEPILFHNEQELEEYFDANPVIADEVRQASLTQAQKLGMENDVLKKLLAENERLTRENRELKASDDEESTDDEAPAKKPRKKRRDRTPLRTLRS